MPTINRMRPRVASLLPSTTEIVCALGAIEQLCGVSHECDWPPELAQRVEGGRLPVLTGARLGPPGILVAPDSVPAKSNIEVGSNLEPPRSAALPSYSAAIDARLRELVAQALSVYVVDETALATARPDIVLTQDLCEVCAVSYAETCRAVAYLTAGATGEGAHPTIISTHPASLVDIYGDIERIASAIGREAAAAELLEQLRARVEAVRLRASAAGGQPPLPAVLTLEWIDPPMPGGLWMAELVEIAGGIPLSDQAGGKTHALSRAQLEAFAPEVVVVKPCGFSLTQGLAEVPALARAVPWDSWPACRAGRVYVADGSAYFNRPGPRIVDSLELLAACVHPQLFAAFRLRYAGSVARIAPDLGVEHW